MYSKLQTVIFHIIYYTLNTSITLLDQAKLPSSDKFMSNSANFDDLYSMEGECVNQQNCTK